MSSAKEDQYRPCIIIPFYNHGKRLCSVVEELLPSGLTIFVVDDGSTEQDSLHALHELPEEVVVISSENNQGKGSALALGFREAYQRDFTHAICLDADGQHCSEDLQRFIQQGAQTPDALILGIPQFDSDAPWERVWGRKLSTLFVWLETRSVAAKDVLFGFRSYPLKQTVRLLDQIHFFRMGFDVEIIVRFLWNGGSVEHIRSPVRYPPDGRSHFHYVRDNIGMIKLHTRLIFESLMPQQLINRKSESNI